MTLLPYAKQGRVEAGIDEAGRGCLFGRVYVAAVIWPQQLSVEPPYEIKDSKKVTPRRRAILRKFIEEHAVDYCVAYLEHHEVDNLNILQATLDGMHKALNGLDQRPDHILVDGDRFRPYQDPTKGHYLPYECVPSGDNIYTSIAAASILAKEHHDEYIRELCTQEPNLNIYALVKNKGYGTQEHRDAIKQHGVSPYHRLSFGICRRFNPTLPTKEKYTKRTCKPHQIKLGNVFANYNK